MAKQYFKKIEIDNVFYSDAQLHLGKIALIQYCGDPTIMNDYDGSIFTRCNEKELLEFTTVTLEKIFKTVLDKKTPDEKSTHLFDALQYFTQSDLLQAQYFSKILFSKYKKSFNLECGLLKNDAALKDIFLKGSWENFQTRIHIARMSRKMSITTPPPIPSSPKASPAVSPALKPQELRVPVPLTPPVGVRRTSLPNVPASASHTPPSSGSPRGAFGGPKPPPRASVTSAAAAPSVQQQIVPSSFIPPQQQRRGSAPVVSVQRPTQPTSKPLTVESLKEIRNGVLPKR